RMKRALKKKPHRYNRLDRQLATLPNEGLSPKMELFVSHYVSNGWNGTRAVMAAGYQVKNARSAGVIASHLLATPKLQDAIRSMLKRHHLSREQVLARLSEIANINITDFLGKNGEIDWKKMKEKGYLVKGRTLDTFTTEAGTSTKCKLELHDSQKALET